MAQHDSFGVSGGAGGVDEGAALVGPQTLNHSIQLLVGKVFSKLQKLVPLQKEKGLNKTNKSYRCVVVYYDQSP